MLTVFTRTTAAALVAAGLLIATSASSVSLAQSPQTEYRTTAAQPVDRNDVYSGIREPNPGREERLRAKQVTATLSSLAIAAIAQQPHRRGEIVRAAVEAAPEYRGAISRNIAAAYPGFASDIAAAAGTTVAIEPRYGAASAVRPPQILPSASSRPTTGPSREARHAIARAASTIATNPLQLENAVSDAVASAPADRDYIIAALSRSYPGFADRIAAASGGYVDVADTSQDDGEAEFIEEDGVDDPFETVNRWIFAFNEGVDFLILRPVAWTYNKLVPDPVILAIRRFFQNLGSPVIFANDILQADLKDAGVTLGRFGINSTFGLLGFLEVAEGMGLKAHHADFGQTLHSYGVGSGPYLVLPLIGPSSVRDGIGLAADTAMNPLTWILPSEWSLGLAAGKGVSRREQLLVPLEELKQGSLDYYTGLKSAYHQNRKVELRKSIVDYNAAPDSESYDKLFDELDDRQ
jgi:phospholipid-binding lipoprotein MlaA